MTAIVCSCGLNGLALTRALSRHGVRVLTTDSRRDVGAFSRHGLFSVCPDPLVDEFGFVLHVLRLASHCPDRPIVFATNDHFVAALSRHAEVLRDRAELCAADWGVVRILLHKQAFATWAAERGYRVPKTRRLCDTDASHNHPYPVILKPECRRTASGDGGSPALAETLDRNRLLVVGSHEELVDVRLRLGPQLDRYVVQEYVPGLSDQMYTVGVYVAGNHEVTALFSGRKIRGYPPDHGDCMVGQSDIVPHHVEEIARNICRDIGYSGLAEFEFKRHPATGEYILLEVNPRSWSWIGVCAACGVDLAWEAYCDLRADMPRRTMQMDVSPGDVKWVRILDDPLNCLWRNASSGYSEWKLSPLDWLRSLRCRRLVIAEWEPGDSAPLVYAVMRIVIAVVARVRRLVRNRAHPRREGSRWTVASDTKIATSAAQYSCQARVQSVQNKSSGCNP